MKKHLSILTIFSAVCFFIPATIFAASIFDIQYPIAELGNCGTQQECKSFCDSPDNQNTCLTWAQDKGLATKPIQKNPQQTQKIDERTGREVQKPPLNEEAFKNAPGGCKTRGECDKYCRVEEHLSECLSYSVSNGYTTQEEADKIIAKSKKGGPGGCKGKEQCDAFCKQPTNAQVCMQFAVDEGKITQEEADLMVAQMEKGSMKGKKPGEGNGPGEPKLQKEKALEILKTKSGPGGCKNEEECKTFCDNADHMQECKNFAKENKLMTDQDLQKMEKLSKGGPGGCKGPEECDAFCGKEENRETCMNFSKENGLITEEEIQMMEKQMSIVKKLEQKGGPGGCKSQEECRNFCSDGNNMETCLNFSKEQGMISPEKERTMKEQVSGFKQQIQQFQGQQQEMLMKIDSQNPMFQPGKEGDVQYGQKPPMMKNQEGQYRQPTTKQTQDGSTGGQYRPQMPPQGYEGQYKPPMRQQPTTTQQKEGSETRPTPQQEYEGQHRPQMPPQGYEGQYKQQMPPQGYEGQYPQPPQPTQNTKPVPPQGSEGQYTQPMTPQGTQFIPNQGIMIPPPPVSLKVMKLLASTFASIFGK